jgi:LysR family hydrogen peroxide-inducible transcriptional activator
MHDYEGTSLDTLRQMVVMGMGIAFLPALYIRSEIHRPQELRVEKVQGEEIYRTHALVWRKSFPASALFRAVAEQIRAFVADELSGELTVAPRRRASRRTKA